jgi:(p)ppGpp synthase/HD superfamily hydrolase
VQVSSSDQLASQALAFAVQCHAGHRRESDGEPFITHPLEVARLLRDAGCSETVVAAGLLHDVVDDSGVDVRELAERFGDDVAALVSAVTDDTCVDSYRRRKQMLRDQVQFAGGDAALVFAADKISEVRHWPKRAGHERARLDDTAPDSRARRFLETQHELRREHYRASLAMLRKVAPQHPLVAKLEEELQSCVA